MDQQAPRTAAVAFLAACCLATVLLTPGAAQAAPVVSLPSGLLTVTVPLAASLTASGSTISGSLGTTTVVDGRLAATGYSVSVSTSGFDLVGPAVNPSSTVTHIPAAAATVRVTAATGVTPSSTVAVALPAALPVCVFTYSSPVLSLNLLSTYTMSLSIAVPSTAATGQYSGTVTQTVI